jgi:hypothetical protein
MFEREEHFICSVLIKNHKIRTTVMEELKEVSLRLKENTFIGIGSTLDPEQEKALVELLNI